MFNKETDTPPESLLDEAVTFARDVMTALQNAGVRSRARWKEGAYAVSIDCLAPDTPEFVQRVVREHSDVLLRPAFEASHPAIVDCCRGLLGEMMQQAGFAASDKSVKSWEGGEFHIGLTQSATTISSIGVSCFAPPEKLKQALGISDEALRYFCLDLLEKHFVEMKAFCELMKSRGIDASKAKDPLDIAQELKDKGLPSPRVIRKNPPGPDPRLN